METTVEDLQWDIEKLRKREQKLNKHLAEALEQVRGDGARLGGLGAGMRVDGTKLSTWVPQSLPFASTVSSFSAAQLRLLCVWELHRLPGRPDHAQHAEGEQQPSSLLPRTFPKGRDLHQSPFPGIAAHSFHSFIHLYIK